jgi:hypothetical protein
VIDMPKKIYELIKRKAYKRISSELFVDIPIGDKTYPLALKGIALLGGETPAVNTLDDVLALYGDGHKILAYDTQAKTRQYELNLTDLEKIEKEKLKMEELEKAKDEIKKLSEVNKTLTEQIEKLTKEIEEIKKFSDEIKVKNEELAKEKRLSVINSKIDKLVQDKKIVPAQIPVLKEILTNSTDERKFKVGEDEISGFDGLIMKFIESSTAPLSTEGKSEKGKNLNEDKVAEIKKYAEENKVSFKEAMIALARTEKK